jgi:hypothetical protein
MMNQSDEKEELEPAGKEAPNNVGLIRRAVEGMELK